MNMTHQKPLKEIVSDLIINFPAGEEPSQPGLLTLALRCDIPVEDLRGVTIEQIYDLLRAKVGVPSLLERVEPVAVAAVLEHQSGRKDAPTEAQIELALRLHIAPHILQESTKSDVQALITEVMEQRDYRLFLGIAAMLNGSTESEMEKAFPNVWSVQRHVFSLINTSRQQEYRQSAQETYAVGTIVTFQVGRDRLLTGVVQGISKAGKISIDVVDPTAAKGTRRYSVHASMILPNQEAAGEEGT